MSNFERVKYYFEKGWATVAQVQTYVQYNVINGEEFEQITGEPYTTANTYITQEQLNSAERNPGSKDNNGISNESIDKIRIEEDEIRSKIIERLKDLF